MGRVGEDRSPVGRSGARAPRRLREEDFLLRRYHREGDLRARERLVERFLPLARTLAGRYSGRGEAFDDLLQVASVGLVKAIDRFDPDRGVAFSSYAFPMILGELKRHFRDAGWALRVPRALQERAVKVNATVERLTGELGRAPTARQVAEELALSFEDVLEAVEANLAYDTAPLELVPARENGGAPIAVRDGEIDRRLALVEDGATVSGALKALPERERTVLYLRFFEDLTQQEIANRIGVSQMHVSRLIRSALELVRSTARVP